jgi:hypothetical protein
VICLSARLQHGSSVLRPGSTAVYAIWIWSAEGARHVTVTARLAARAAVGPARFSVCPAGRHAVCSIATLPPRQAFELLVSVPIRKSATPHGYLTLTVAAQAPGVSPANASISSAVAPVAEPTTTTPAPPPPTTLPPVAAPPPLAPPTTVTPGSLPSLFPTVTPTPAARSPGVTHQRHHRLRATLTAATLPVNLRLIGGQLAGLAVLAAAVIMVIARLSLRSPRPAGDAPKNQAAKTAPPKRPGAAD